MEQYKIEDIESNLSVLERRIAIITRDISRIRFNLSAKADDKVLEDIFLIQSTLAKLATGMNNLICKSFPLFESTEINQETKWKSIKNAKNSEFIMWGCAETWRKYNYKINELIKY